MSVSTGNLCVFAVFQSMAVVFVRLLVRSNYVMYNTNTLQVELGSSLCF